MSILTYRWLPPPPRTPSVFFMMPTNRVCVCVCVYIYIYVVRDYKLKGLPVFMLTAVLLICVHLIYVHCHPRMGVHSLGSSKSPVLSTEAIEHNLALKGGSFSSNQD